MHFCHVSIQGEPRRESNAECHEKSKHFLVASRDKGSLTVASNQQHRDPVQLSKVLPIHDLPKSSQRKKNRPVELFLHGVAHNIIKTTTK